MNPFRRAPQPAGGCKTTAWVRRHKLVSALIVLVVLGWTVDTAAGVDQNADGGSVSDASSADRSDDESDTERWRTRASAAEPASDSREKKAARRAATSGPARPTVSEASRQRTRAPEPRTYLVTRVIDGDTIELGNGSDVRIVGIDTPEVGQCGYDAATNNMARLVLNKQVRLTMSDEDTDRYGRWLRYVNVGPVDAGLQQIKQGFRHRQVRLEGRLRVPRPRTQLHRGGPRVQGDVLPQACPAPVSSGGGACAPGYDPCVPPFPPDVDCADVDGPIIVTGADPHGLDADGDGVACE